MFNLFSKNTIVNQVAAHVGSTLWNVQVLERAVAYHLAAVYRLQPGDAVERATAVFEELEGLPLGPLLTQLRTLRPNGDSLVARLDIFRVERNWLVHHSRHDSPAAVHNAVLLASLRRRLGDISREAIDLAKKIQDLTDQHLIANGQRTKEGLAATAEGVRRAWHTGHPAKCFR